ncbi:DM13 domain-containing protein [Synechocystis sp. PCC 7509]|uniref:DM13 domain-containing protein n=1 Tax=Synechocystis sp. PCC 7509 TaxID=927677 RepID=UPI0002AC6938|nr:DM13 domain-containing protein [Synechocystis sp. PCC 7509]
MKLKHLAIASISLLLFACTNQTPPDQAIATITPVVETSKNAIAKFVTVSHSTEGGVRVITANGKRYLEFDETFKTEGGPDVLVLLHRDRQPKEYQQQKFISLGHIQKFSGTQRYTIPDNVNLADFRSVVVRCRLFSVTFGYAPLI